MSLSIAQTDPELQRVFETWAEYQKTHDVSALHGKPVGVDSGFNGYLELPEALRAAWNPRYL